MEGKEPGRGGKARETTSRAVESLGCYVLGSRAQEGVYSGLSGHRCGGLNALYLIRPLGSRNYSFAGLVQLSGSKPSRLCSAIAPVRYLSLGNRSCQSRSTDVSPGKA